MNDNLPPLPEPFCNAHEDAWSYWPDTFSAAQMQAYARAAIERQSAAPQPQPVQQFELTEYDAGLLNDFGGGNVEWWQDYIRAELGRAYEHYQSQIPAKEKSNEHHD